MSQNVDNENYHISILLILSNYYNTSMPSWPEVMGVFGSSLHKRGHNVDWILPNRTGIIGTISTTKFNDSTLYLIPFTKSDNPFLIFLSLFFYQIRIFYLINYLIKINNYNILMVRDDEISGVAAVIFKKLYKIKFIFNYSFPHYQGALDVYNDHNKHKTKLLYYKLLNIILIHLIFKKSDYIFPISNEMKNDIINTGVAESIICPLPLGVDLEAFQNRIEPEKIRKRHGIKSDDFLFIYVGSLASVRGLNVLLEAFNIVVAEDKKTKLLIVGSGNDMNNLVNITRNLNLNEHVIFTNQIPFLDVPSYIAASDVGVSIIKPLVCFRVSSPCKLFEYMAMRKPVIANKEIPEQMRVINESHCGLLTDYSAKSISERMLMMIKQHYEDSSSMKILGDNGRRWVSSNRTFDILSVDVENACKKLLGQK